VDARVSHLPIGDAGHVCLGLGYPISVWIFEAPAYRWSRFRIAIAERRYFWCYMRITKLNDCRATTARK
jgi:hypothetical protein